MSNRCGYITEPHEPHEYGAGGAAAAGRQCPGLTQEELDVDELDNAVRNFRWDNPDGLPDGSRLLCHATVHNALVTQFQNWLPHPSGIPGAYELGKMYELPICVVPTPGMQHGEWMLLTNELLVKRGVMKGG